MNEILSKLLLGQLQSIGLFREKQTTAADLRNRVIALYHRWLDETIAVLERNGALAFDGRTCVLRDPSIVDVEAAWAEWNAEKGRALENPSQKAQLVLVEATLRALPNILTGKQPATDVMFPKSSMMLVEGIYKNNPVSDYFNEALADTVVAYLKECLEQDASAQIRILEIGAGTGGTSAMLFKKLKPYQQHVREYCYTDISKAFLMHAEKEYGPQFPYLTYKLFNVEQPLDGQGIEAGGYDLVIATNVLHATKNIRLTLRHAKAALQPNGLILLNEISDNSLFTHLTFGLLEGWWLYEDPELRIPGCPGLYPQDWQRALEAEGYQNVFFPAERAHDLGQQIVVAESDGVVVGQTRQAAPAPSAPVRRTAPSQASAATSDLVVEDYVRTAIRESICETLKMDEDEIQDDLSFAEYGVDSILAVNLINLINEKCGITLQTTVLFDYNSVDQLTKHILQSHKSALLSRVQESAPQETSAPAPASVSAPAPAPAPAFVPPTAPAPVIPQAQPRPVRNSARTVSDQVIEDHVRTVIRESIAETLKMDEFEIEDDQSFAEYGVDSILAVNLINRINEECNITLQTTVLFDYNNVTQLCKHIVQTHKAALSQQLQVVQPEAPQPIQETSAFQAPFDQEPVSVPAQRPIRATAPAVPQPLTPTVVESLERSDLPTYHKVVIDRPGAIDDLRLVEAVVPELKDNEVQIAVRAFSLNFGDILCVRGLYPTMPPYPFTPGFEASGVVVKVGRAVTTVVPGDEVVFGAAEAFGAQASLITCAAEQVSLKPQDLTFEEACALPTVALTMIDAFRKAQLKKGEKILIQTATGGTGLIAVQLAQHLGAEIYATAGSQHKLDYLKSMGVHHVINYLESDFEQEVKRLTNGQGVDVVINTLSGEAIQKGMNCLRSGGRYIEIAMTALKSAKSIDLSVLNNNQIFYSVDLRKLSFERPEMIGEYQNELDEYVQQGIVRPTIFREFSFEQIKEAYQCMDNRGNIGKIVVSIPEAYQYREVEVTESGAEAGATARKQAVYREPIAIIGMSGRFAQSKNVGELWEHLANGTNLIGEVNRWDLSKHIPADKPYCNYGSFLEDIDRFDPVFFNISGREATYMDPQQRLFLEESWNALEDAGYVGEHDGGLQCGVYAGCCVGDYQALFGGESPAQAFWGNHNSVIPSRIAYHLNLQGPAVSIDTACSSSLVAIHNACQALWMHEIEMALAGGVFVQSTPGFYISSNRAGMLSPTGKCHTFDQNADGFVPGEGVGLVVLKRLSEAIADGDQIYGVIRGSGLNQDGTTNGITAPSAVSQERLERSVYDTFQINPEEIQMVEAHGTGTILGDPIEFGAITNAFRAYTDKKEFCAIGSVKTNLGHAAAAAGIAGVFKILLSLQNKQIPPSLHFKEGNSHITFQDSPFYVNTSLKDWQVAKNEKRVAAISSFGFSGTNAHIVIEEAPKLARKHQAKPGYLIVLSARTAEQLQQQAGQLVAHCEENEGLDCGNISYTLLLGRRHFSHRLAVVVRNQDELVKILKKWLEKGKAPQVFASNLLENARREVPSLKRYGNQCIQDCRTASQMDQYVENLAAIAELFVQGYTLEFANLFPRGQYSKISLPTYPFARERYWVAEAAQPTAAPAPALQAPSASTLQPYTPSAPSMAPALQAPSASTLQPYTPSAPTMAPAPQAPSAAASVSARQLQDELKSSLAEILFINQSDIDVNTKFIDMGLDSIIGVEWVQSLNKKYGITVTANNVYEHPSIAEFAEFLVGELQANGSKAPTSPVQAAVIQPIKTAPAPAPVPAPAPRPAVAEVAATVEAPNAPARMPQQSVASTKQLQEELVESLAEILFVNKSDIEVNKKFIEMGLDSIIGVEWVQALNKKYGISITANNVYEHPSIAEFSQFLANELNGAPSPAASAPSIPVATALQPVSTMPSQPSPAAPAPSIPVATALQPVSTMPSQPSQAGAPTQITLKPVHTIKPILDLGMPPDIAPPPIRLSPLQPVQTGVSAPQPAAPQPAAPQPAALQPVTPQPAALQPVTPQPVTPQPVTPQPVTPQPAAPKTASKEPEPATYNRAFASLDAPLPLSQIKAPDQFKTEWPQYPELVPLNKATTGRPVFWLHAALGGVELYMPLAMWLPRPFYGIQARGWLTDRPPLEGIQAMATYYVEIIRTVQPEGPYDLGGYSLGGMLAYEITRQLQEMGEVVNSIVMLDTFDSVGAKKIDIPDSLFDKNLAFQTVNASLFAPIVRQPEKMASTLIHRFEANADLPYEEFLEQLVQLAKSRGLTRSENLMHKMIQQGIKVQEAYNITDYSIEPLPRPDEVKCYYFRNKNGYFLGELDPYFAITEYIFTVDHENYWGELEKCLPNIEIMDVDAPNHLMLLSENAVFRTISQFCEAMYSAQGMPPDFFEAFRRETEQIHGHMFGTSRKNR